MACSVCVGLFFAEWNVFLGQVDVIFGHLNSLVLVQSFEDFFPVDAFLNLYEFVHGCKLMVGKGKVQAVTAGLRWKCVCFSLTPRGKRE